MLHFVVCETQVSWVAHLKPYSFLDKILACPIKLTYCFPHLGRQILSDVDFASLVVEFPVLLNGYQDPLFVAEVVKFDDDGSVVVSL